MILKSVFLNVPLEKLVFTVSHLSDCIHVHAHLYRQIWGDLATSDREPLHCSTHIAHIQNRLGWFVLHWVSNQVLQTNDSVDVFK